MTDFVQTLVSSITVGSLYALIALGYTMVYGILRFINFAHGDIVVLGAWFSSTLATKFGYVGADAPWYAGLLVLLCSCAALQPDRVRHRAVRLPSAPPLPAAQHPDHRHRRLAPAAEHRHPDLGLRRQPAGDAEPLAQPRPRPHDVRLRDGRDRPRRRPDPEPLGDSGWSLLQYLVFHTSLGRAMRAISFNADTAALMGIPVDRVVSMTFVLGSALAAAAGFLFVMKYPRRSQPPRRSRVGPPGTQGVRGSGRGRDPEASAGQSRGACVIAFVEQFGMFYIGASYRDVHVFGLLVLILLVKPTGILGSPLREKV